DAACVALEQGRTQQRFQLAYVVADRAGGQVQFLGGMGKVLVSRRGGEHRQGRQQGGADDHGRHEPDLWLAPILRACRHRPRRGSCRHRTGAAMSGNGKQGGSHRRSIVPRPWRRVGARTAVPIPEEIPMDGSKQCLDAGAAASPPVAPADAGRDWRTPLELLALGAVWGGSFLFMRVAAPEFGPYALVELRLALGAMVLLPFLWLARAQFPLRIWPKLAAIGVVNSALPFLLFAWAAQRAPAAIGAICNAMVVLFAALVAYLVFGEKIGARRAVALL